MEGNLIIKCDSCEEGLADSDEKRNNNTIVHEVTDWLELTTEQQSDLGPRTRQRKQVCLRIPPLYRMESGLPFSNKSIVSAICWPTIKNARATGRLPSFGLY
jgi:hypothetical protein